MRGNSAEEVAERVLGQTSLCGLQVMIRNMLTSNSHYVLKLVVYQPCGKMIIFMFENRAAFIMHRHYICDQNIDLFII